MPNNVFSTLVDQEAAITQIQRAAQAARALITQPAKTADQADQADQAAPARAAAQAENSPTAPAPQAAQENQVSAAAMSHAWLITGPPGSGRSLAARAFAAALECHNDANLGCGECASCKAVMAGNHPDVEIKATEAVTISAQEVRALVAQAYLAPANSPWRIFIIEDADRMLSRTTNVLLKAIEEPAAHTVWILCTTAPADVLPTIRSRCRIINLVTPSPQAVARLLETRDGADPAEAAVAAQAAQSHIGVARALIHDPSAKALRKRTLEALTLIRGVGDAVISAKALTDPEYMLAPLTPNSPATQTAPPPNSTAAQTVKAAQKTQAAKNTKSTKANRSKSTTATTQADRVAEAEQAARIAKMEALGLDPTAPVPATVRAQIGAAAENEKRRKTRAQHDMIDRELTYLTSYFRDVLMLQIGATQHLINPDFTQSIEQRAGATKATQTLKVLDTLNEARTRLTANVAPQLLLEAALIETHLQSSAANLAAPQ